MAILHAIGAAAKWLVSAGASVFSFMKQNLAANMGVGPQSITAPEMGTMLDLLEKRIVQQIKDQFDKEIIRKLHSAGMQIMQASQVQVPAHKQSLLMSVESRLFDTIALPQQGLTDGIPNSKLRSFAYLCLAHIYTELGEPQILVAEMMTQAIRTDYSYAQGWLGLDTIPSTCPQCGRQARPGAKFCNHDRQPMLSGKQFALRRFHAGPLVP